MIKDGNNQGPLGLLNCEGKEVKTNQDRLSALYESHDLEDEGERLFIRGAFEAGVLNEENCAALLAAHRAGSQRTHDQIVDTEVSRTGTPRRKLVTERPGGSASE